MTCGAFTLLLNRKDTQFIYNGKEIRLHSKIISNFATQFVLKCKEMLFTFSPSHLL